METTDERERYIWVRFGGIKWYRVTLSYDMLTVGLELGDVEGPAVFGVD